MTLAGISYPPGPTFDASVEGLEEYGAGPTISTPQSSPKEA